MVHTWAEDKPTAQGNSRLFIPTSSNLLALFCLQKQRKKLAEKIDQLNSAIDDISTQLRSDDTPNGAAVNSDDVEAVV